jgi:large subunit ribosomal protein L16
MLLSPKRTKYRKQQKRKGLLNNPLRRERQVVDLEFGRYGLRVCGCGRLTAKQLESTRNTMMRMMRASGSKSTKLWLRTCADIPVTAKPNAVRMGKGKGNHDHWASYVAAGRILFELDGVSVEVAREVVRCGGAKLPMGTKFVLSRFTEG